MSWNLDGLSVEKARNPGVVNVVGKILSRYHITVAVIEGIRDPLGLKEVIQETKFPFKKLNNNLLFFCFQLCENINKLGLSNELTYLCTTTDGSVGYLHSVTLQIHHSTSCYNLPIYLVTIENKKVKLALVTCSLAKATDNASTTLVSQLVKAVMDLSPTERILCLVDLNHANHALCKFLVFRTWKAFIYKTIIF